MTDEKNSVMKKTEDIINGSRVGNEMPDDMVSEADKEFLNAREYNKLNNDREKINENAFNDVDALWERAKKKILQKKKQAIL